MLYLLSFINLIKNLIVKIWSYKPVRIIVYLYVAYYFSSGFYSKVATRISSANLEFLGWDTIFIIPKFSFNPNFIKSNKASFGIFNAFKMLVSVFTPGLLMVALILYLQKVFNTFKAPPLPIIYQNEEAEEVLVEDYRMPELFTKDE